MIRTYNQKDPTINTKITQVDDDKLVWKRLRKANRSKKKALKRAEEAEEKVKQIEAQLWSAQFKLCDSYTEKSILLRNFLNVKNECLAHPGCIDELESYRECVEKIEQSIREGKIWL